MRLALQDRDIVKSLLPILKEHGPEITIRFYQRMFEAHPELLNIFNHANQLRGEQQQALATAVYAAAAHIDNLEAIVPVLRHVSYKHCSLGIQPEYYPIVGRHLTLAIQDVLGSAVAPETLAAWQAAYKAIADTFITIEQDIYRSQVEQHGGWIGFRPFRVTQKRPEALDIVSFYLEPVDGQPLAAFQPGQYVSVKMYRGGYNHLRQYSLSDVSGIDYYRIAVKREESGEGVTGAVSLYMHSLREGDHVELSAPAGDFTLAQGNSLIVLLAAGIGITPLLSMLKTTLRNEPERRIMLAYAVRSGAYHAFADELHQLAAEHEQFSLTTWYEHPTDEDRRSGTFDYSGRISQHWLHTQVPHDASIYACGPRPFMQIMLGTLRKHGFCESQFHYEVFGPSLTFQIN